MNGTGQPAGCRTVIRLKAAPSAASMANSAGAVSRQPVKTIPNVTSGMDWKAMAPVMLPRARVSSPWRTQATLLSFFGQFGGQRRDDQRQLIRAEPVRQVFGAC